MIKLASADDWESLQGRPPVEIKVSSRGLLDGDRRKVAAEVGDRFLQSVRDVEDQLDRQHMKFAHVISCGATEFTGPNRNADGWKAASLRDDMHTYIKHAKAFRDHKNSQQDLYYGLPKVAMYDGDRGYGRVLVGYFADDKALPDKLARVADLEIEALAKHGEFKVSHGTRIPFDSCVICGNQAAKRADYCKAASEGGTCQLFGCTNGLSKIAEDGREQYVDNSNNKFYDMSSVGLAKDSARQADRIAFASPIEYMMKQASAAEGGIVKGSAWLAESLGLSPRYDLQSMIGGTEYQQRMMDAALRMPSVSALSKTALADDAPERLSALHHWDHQVRHAAVETLAHAKTLPNGYSFAKAGGANDATAMYVNDISGELISTAITGGTLPTLIKASTFTSAHVIVPGYLRATVDVVSENNLTDKRAAFRVAVQNAYGGHDKLADASSQLVDRELAAKLAIDYAGMRILFASHFLAKYPIDCRF